MAVGGGFFDQYSVFCVFGSVVGCVVVPLITQSVESVIFSAIVISLTARHITKRASKTDNANQVNVKDAVDKRPRSKLKEREREQVSHVKKRKPVTNQLQQMTIRVPDGRNQKDDQQIKKRLDLTKKVELERKQEEKKERKVKKKEERLKRKEQEREEKEKEEQRLKTYKEQRQKEMRENFKQGDKNSLLQRVDSGKMRLVATSKTTRKVDSSTASKSPIKVPGSPVLTMQFLARQRSQSEGSESEPPSPPPSVWKVPEYVEPKWNPGKLESKKGSKQTRLNNDVVCAKVKLEPPFNQLHNPVYNSPSFKKNQFMNQNPEKTQAPRESKTTPHPTEFSKVKDMDKPDNRQVKFTTYSSFSGLDLLSQLKEENKLSDAGVRSYSLFGPDEPNSTIFRSPLTGN